MLRKLLNNEIRRIKRAAGSVEREVQKRSGDLLLEALVACAGVTLSAVSTSMGIEIKDAVVKAEGDLDFRGTLGVSKDVPVGFSAIRLSFILDTEASEELIQKLLKLTERYCVVYQTLVSATEVKSNIEIRKQRR